MSNVQTSSFRKGEEIPVTKLDAYLEEIPDMPIENLSITQFTAGFSNLTYLLKKGNWEGVLRRAPIGKVAPKAHDMEREFEILKEINAFYPLAPKPYLYCEDDEIVGKPFLVMEFKKGILLEDPSSQHQVTAEDGKRLSELFIDNLVEIHKIPYQSTELLKISKPEGFLERQVAGWSKRFEQAITKEYSLSGKLMDWLESNLPQQQNTAIIHNDYKFNNMIFSEDLRKIQGLVDWEMATVGDPLLDLGVAMSYWVEETDSEKLKAIHNPLPITVKPGFYSREQLIQRYSEKSGIDMMNFPYYLAFSYFKLAVICAQIFKRYELKQTSDKRFQHFDQFTETLIETAWETAKEWK